MKSLKTKFILGAVAIVIFFGVLIFLSFGNAFSPEKKIDGIENVGVSFENFKIPTKSDYESIISELGSNAYSIVTKLDGLNMEKGNNI